MEDSLIIDATERYFNGQMDTNERIYFEELRKNNPELDQQIVEYIYFLKELEKFGDRKRLTHKINEASSLLSTKGLTKPFYSSPYTKVIFLWNKYKKTIAVAASIAIIVSVISATIISYFSPGKQNNIKPLVEKLKQQDAKYKNLEKQIGQLNQLNNKDEKPRVESNFRATGFMIDVDNNLIITNAHVLSEAAHQIIVENRNGEQYSAQSVYINTLNDIAILKIIDKDFKKMKPMPYTIKSKNAELGESVFILGYPKQEIVYGEGYISAENGYEMDTSFCQLSTLANEGNSGSPVINKKGEVIGIISSKETNSEGVVYAIKSSNIFVAIEEIKKDNGNAKITSKSTIRNSDRQNQIKKVEDYVFMIKGN